MMVIRKPLIGASKVTIIGVFLAVAARRMMERLPVEGSVARLPAETITVKHAGRAGEKCGCETRCRPNGSDVKLRGQGPRGYGSAARRLPAFELRGAGGVTPRKYR